MMYNVQSSQLDLAYTDNTYRLYFCLIISINLVVGLIRFGANEIQMI